MRSVITFSLHISNSKFKTSYLEFKLKYVSKEIHIVNLNRFTFYHVYELLFICIVHYPQWVEIHFETGLPNLNIFNYIPCYGFFFPCYGLDWFFFFLKTERKGNQQKVFITLYIISELHMRETHAQSKEEKTLFHAKSIYISHVVGYFKNMFLGLLKIHYQFSLKIVFGFFTFILCNFFRANSTNFFFSKYIFFCSWKHEKTALKRCL